ncbi:ABC transporter permease [Rubrolithibacter danxiaensis]|uniref:ABC transporter permease n=1 Tax=Rubrolithibacter danxiaensis TaxID=3390805 RepID=UPI003BF7C20D
MLKNYLKIAWRNLFKHKAFSFINIAGLTIGMVCTMLLLLWVYNERVWDKFNQNYDRIYHILSNRNFNGEITTGPDMMYPLAKALKIALPEVEAATTVSFGENTLFAAGDKKLKKRTVFTSPDFFNTFTFKFIHGNAAAVKDPTAVILTESTAIALFNTDDVIGQAVRVNNGRTAYVKAVIKDVPRNSTLQFDGIMPFNPDSPEIKEAENEWVNCSYRVFLKTTVSANTSALEQKILQLIKERTEKVNPTTKGSIVLHPMSKWRLYEEFKDGKNTGGRIQYVHLFTWIAIVILIIACVNFMNLSTASSEKRAKEVGVRKTLGSERNQLLWQFLTESVLLSLIAFFLAAIIVYISVPVFSRMLDLDLQIPVKDPLFWVVIAGIIGVTGFIAGSYPAFYLSGFSPVKVLKGTFLPGHQALLPRKILVVSQFIVSIILISATLVIYRQIQYVKNRDLGYNPDNLIMVPSSSATDKSFKAIKNDLLQSGMISSVARSSSPLTTILGFTSGIRWPGAGENSNLVIGFLFADGGFSKTINAKMLNGRDFSDGDSNSVIFNKEAVKLMGLKSPVGSEITWAGKKRTIVGVIDNMVMVSPYEAASPLMICYEDKWSGSMNIRLSDKADVRKSLVTIENVYKKYSPEYPFEYKFVDDDFNLKFNTEDLIGKLSLLFAGVAIFICCLGLFGLVSFSIERRAKEIGVRKVLGASIRQLLLLMSKEFLLLVAFAFFVAVPAAWWGMNEWLKNYAYRINISIGIFVLVGFSVLLLTIITVCLNALKSAIVNPIKSLRTE